MNDDFKFLIQSLGENSVSTLEPLGLDALNIYANDVAGTARVAIALRKNDWETRRAALAKLIDIRLMFIDELAIEFCFEECADTSEAEDGDREFEFV